jgi:hypothetical protein
VPTGALVDADDAGLRLRIDAKAGGKRLQRRLPEPVLLAVAAEHEADLGEGILSPHQHLTLGHGLALLLGRRERDPTGEHVALWGHEGEGLLVGVQDEKRRWKLHAAADGRPQERDLPGRDPRQWCMELSSPRTSRSGSVPPP